MPGVWVLGDVKGGPAFAHVSYDDYLVIYDNVVNGKDRTIDKRVVPYALYTDPELGRVGLERTGSESKAGYKLKIGSVPMAYVARAIERGETNGLMKIVINADNDRILGATILGAGRGRTGADPDDADAGGCAVDAVREPHVHSPHAGRGLLLADGQCGGRLTLQDKCRGGLGLRRCRPDQWRYWRRSGSPAPRPH